MENTFTGLTSKQVAERVADGRVNANADVRTRTIPRIVRDNICTLFNLINVILAIAILWTGSYRNLLFFGVVILNVVIGITQEVKSKLTIDKLSVLTSQKVQVIRDGSVIELPVDQIVLDDIIKLNRGCQVPSDCEVVDGICFADESLLTGESDLIHKQSGSKLYSGSFVSSGSCTARVIAVGADNLAVSINNEVKAYKKVVSGIMDALNKIIKYSTIVLVPLGILLLGKEMLLAGSNATDAILRTSAALVGMIPQGLILLTSGVLAISVVRLAKHKVLVQELYCVETLARVDVVCLDKTGTITTGEMDVDELVPFGSASSEDAQRALAALDLATGEDALNETGKAIRAYVQAQCDVDTDELHACFERLVPFSSEHKYSGACYGQPVGSFVMGAAEFVLRGCPQLKEVQDIISAQGGTRRAIVVAHVSGFDENDAIQGTVEPVGIVFIRDRIRENAEQTLKYFNDEGVRINIISGDAVETVAHIAEAVGVPDADKYVDMSTVKTDEQLEQVARDCRVFGRVSPAQKKKLVIALQAQGHTVAMTGDGVNDVLAMHSADCSVAMGSGSDAARNVAQLILLNNDFASLPHVVAEGRRSINNLQRSGALFLVKTIFSAVLAFLFLFIFAYSYPFVTIQLTFVGGITIGLPSFVLALEPNTDIVRGNFLRTIVSRALPGAASIVVAVLLSCAVCAWLGCSQDEFSTLCVVLSCISGLNFIIRLSRPFTPVRVVLFIVCLLGVVGGIFIIPEVFMLVPLSQELAIAAVALAVVVCVFFNLLYTWVDKRLNARMNAEAA